MLVNATLTTVVTVGFNPIEYIVDEEGSGVFIVELSAPVQRDVTVMLITSSVTALGRLLRLFFKNIYKE